MYNSMNTKYPINRYNIKYNSDSKKFYMLDSDGKIVGEDVNGRELGREAWWLGAEEVCYNYDLGLDERLPLMSTYEKLKARNRMP